VLGRWQVVQRLADARLVVTDRTPDGQEVAELVHEALITSFTRLVRPNDLKGIQQIQAEGGKASSIP
jgi:hypothetical protein